ncbi:MAG: hypothetical protein DRN59_02865 [Thaumarchaeota archaeon]|nr:MAG: hypothetical protein DRN59_02865 [Nitrososphaerota archaeon]
MATLEQARTFGGIGSILMILTIVPFAGPILGIIGFVLVLIAVKYISEIVGDPSIFKNYLIAVILSIAGVVVISLAGFAAYLALIPPMAGGPERLLNIFSLSVIGVLVAVWILLIIAAIFIRRSFNSIASALNVKMFSTAALLYLIGAILTIAFGIGGIISFIAIILQIIAFFQIPIQKA